MDDARKKLEEINKFRSKLGKKTGVTVSSADVIKDDRENAH